MRIFNVIIEFEKLTLLTSFYYFFGNKKLLEYNCVLKENKGRNPFERLKDRNSIKYL